MNKTKMLTINPDVKAAPIFNIPTPTAEFTQQIIMSLELSIPF